MAKARRKRRTFSLEDKKNILGEIAAGKKLVDVAKKYKMQPAQLSQWKSKYGGAKKKKATVAKPATKRVVRKVSAVPKASAPRAAAAVSSHISVSELEQMIGRLTVENTLLRRQLEELGSK